MLEPSELRALEMLLERRLAEVSDDVGVPWPCVDFPTVPTGQSRVKVPVWAVLEVLVPHA